MYIIMCHVNNINCLHSTAFRLPAIDEYCFVSIIIVSHFTKIIRFSEPTDY